MKDDREEYEELMKMIRGLDPKKTLTALKNYSDRGNINATFNLWASRRFNITDEEKQAYWERLVRQYDEEPLEFDGDLMIGIGTEFQDRYCDDNKRLDNLAEALKWFTRAYDLDDPDAARWILFTYEYSRLEGLDDEYCEWCIRVLKDADFYIENDTMDFAGMKDSRETVGDAINAIIKMANRGNSRAQHTIGTMFLNGGFLGKDEDVGRKWIERSQSGNV